MKWISDVSYTVNISIIRHVINKLKVRGTFQDKITFSGISVRLRYCNGYGICYTTASKIYVTSLRQTWPIWCLLRNGFQNTRYITKTDVSIASQRLEIPRQRLK
jgi:hypothetical protein